MCIYNFTREKKKMKFTNRKPVFVEYDAIKGCPDEFSVFVGEWAKTHKDEMLYAFQSLADETLSSKLIKACKANWKSPDRRDWACGNLPCLSLFDDEVRVQPSFKYTQKLGDREIALSCWELYTQWVVPATRFCPEEHQDEVVKNDILCMRRAVAEAVSFVAKVYAIDSWNQKMDEEAMAVEIEPQFLGKVTS